MANERYTLSGPTSARIVQSLQPDMGNGRAKGLQPTQLAQPARNGNTQWIVIDPASYDAGSNTYEAVLWLHLEDDTWEELGDVFARMPNGETPTAGLYYLGRQHGSRTVSSVLLPLFLIVASGGGGSESLSQTDVTLSADTNNWAITTAAPGASWINLTVNNAAGIDLTGIAAPPAGTSPVYLVSIDTASTGPLNITNQSSLSSSTNRFSTSTGQNVTYLPGQVFQIAYDQSNQKWKAIPGDKPVDEPVALQNLTADVDDLDFGSATVVNVNQDETGGHAVTGLVAGTPGQIVTINNVSNSTFYLPAGDTGSTSGNRIDTITGSDAGLAPGGSADLQYTVTDEVQLVDLASGTASGGTFTLDLDGLGPTSALDWDATAAEVTTALEALVGSGNVTVTGSTIGGGYNVTFINDYGGQNVNAMTINGGSLTGSSPVAQVTTTTAGGSGAWNIIQGQNVTYSPTVVSQLTTNTNDLNLGYGNTFLLTSDGDYNLTGFTTTGGNRPGDTLTLINTGSYTLTIPNQSGSSSAGNRITTPTGGSLTLAPGDSLQVIVPSAGGGYRADGGTSAIKQLAASTGVTAEWTKYTINYDDVDVYISSPNATRTLVSLSVNQFLQQIVVRPTQSWSGGSISQAGLAILITPTALGDSTLIESVQLFGASADDDYVFKVWPPPSYSGAETLWSGFFDNVGGAAIKAKVSVGAFEVLDDATQGSVDIWLLIHTLP